MFVKLSAIRAKIILYLRSNHNKSLYVKTFLLFFFLLAISNCKVYGCGCACTVTLRDIVVQIDRVIFLLTTERGRSSAVVRLEAP